MNKIDLNKYQDFVQEVTSGASNSTMMLNQRLIDLDRDTGVNMALLLTAAIGLAAEGGEFCEIPKKVAFQGKPLDQDTIFHMKRELGDVMWYCAVLAAEMGMDLGHVMENNLRKLADRKARGTLSGSGDNR